MSLTTLFLTNNYMLIFITSHLSFEYRGIYYTNTGSNQITGNYWPHTKTLYDNKPMAFTILSNAVPNVPCTSTFDLTTCYLMGGRKEGRQGMFYLTTHSTHFKYGYTASDIL